MTTIALTMQLKPGCADTYRARHDAIWSDLVALLKAAGIADYSIHLHPATGTLFARLSHGDVHAMDALPDEPVMRRWWAHMADLMETNADGSPTTVPLVPMFQLD